MLIDYKIDKTIIQILNDEKIIKQYSSHVHGKKNGLHFNGMLEALEDYYHAITRRVLSLHLARLKDESNRIIDRSDFKPGLPRFYWLSRNTKLALELGLPIYLPIYLKSKRREFQLTEGTEENKKSYLLLLSLAAIGVSLPQPVEDELNAPLGSFYDQKLNKAFYMSTPLPDVAASDFLHRNRDFGNGNRFQYIKFKKKKEVEWYFQRLSEFEPPILGPAEEIEWIKMKRYERNLKLPPFEENRYGIVDKKLHEFMSYCVAMLSATATTMDYVWRYERGQETEERKWYEYIHGKVQAKHYFTRINEKRIQMERIIGKTTGERKKTKTAAEVDLKICREVGDFQSPKYKHAEEVLMYFVCIKQKYSLKSWPYSLHQKLSNKEYDNVRVNYSIIADALMKLAYPDFMNNIFPPIT
jgi:hypothetical protein